ncbi:TPA: hypothetical protein OMS33_000925 [Enterobacter hormaechei]|nr:hypothetical protein [Enterobacter hormaechei]
MAATIFSVLISLGTLGMAFSALDTWRQQEMLKLKMEFKRSILELIYAMDSMPRNWSYHQINLARARLQASPEVANRVADPAQIYINKMALKDAFSGSTKAWIMCEHLFSETEIEVLWNKFRGEFRDYIMRGGDTNRLAGILESLNVKLKVL